MRYTGRATKIGTVQVCFCSCPRYAGRQSVQSRAQDPSADFSCTCTASTCRSERFRCWGFRCFDCIQAGATALMFRAEDCSEITRANVDPSAPPTPQMNLQVGSMDYLLLGYNPGARSVDLDVDKPMVVIMPKVTHTHAQTRTTHTQHIQTRTRASAYTQT